MARIGDRRGRDAGRWMRRVLATGAAAAIAWPGAAAAQRAPQVGDRIYITGCEDGELRYEEVRLWNRPLTMSGVGLVGHLQGTGPEGRCRGSIVTIEEIREEMLRMYYQIRDVRTGQRGWVTESFVGPRFDTARCEALFQREDQINRCKPESTHR